MCKKVLTLEAIEVEQHGIPGPIEHSIECSIERSIECSIERAIECSTEFSIECSTEFSIGCSIECSTECSNRMLYRMFYRMLQSNVPSNVPSNILRQLTLSPLSAMTCATARCTSVSSHSSRRRPPECHPTLLRAMSNTSCLIGC